MFDGQGFVGEVVDQEVESHALKIVSEGDLQPGCSESRQGIF